MTGPDEEHAVPDGGPQDEATSGETLAGGEHGEAHVAPAGTGEMAPTGRTLEPEEVLVIEGQFAALTLTNQGRSADDQVSLSPQDVN